MTMRHPSNAEATFNMAQPIELNKKSEPKKWHVVASFKMHTVLQNYKVLMNKSVCIWSTSVSKKE